MTTRMDFLLVGYKIHLQTSKLCFKEKLLLFSPLPLLNIYQHQGVGATAGALRAPRTMLTLSRALLQAPGSSAGSSETPACNLTATSRGSEESEDPSETRKSRSFSTSQV